MKPNKKIALKTLFVAGVIFANCAPINNAGNISQTGNGMVAGVIYNKDGSFAKNATVQLRKKHFLADTAGQLTKELAAPQTVTTTTNDAGMFAVKSIDTGTYAVEASDGNNNLAFNDSVKVENKDVTVNLPPDTLSSAGAIKGVIRLSQGGDASKAYVLAFGVDRFAKVNADGSFKLAKIAEGAYDLRLTSALASYGERDTSHIAVKSGDTTNIGTIELPYTGIPVPKITKTAYDSLNQLVTLQWSRLDTARVKNFTIYRKTIDSNTAFAKLNKISVIDTFYIDSTGVQDQTHEYRITAIDKNGNESVKSEAVVVKIGTYFAMDTVYAIGSSDMAPAKNGDIYVVNSSAEIRVYDSALRLKRQFTTQPTFTPQRITVDNGRIFAVYPFPDNPIMIFDTAMTVIDSIVEPLFSSFPVKDIDARDGSLYVLQTGDSNPSRQMISVYAEDGTKKRSWNLAGAAGWGVINVVSPNRILVSSGDENIVAYDTLGNKTSSIAPSLAAFGSFAFDEKKQMLYVLAGFSTNEGAALWKSTLLGIDKNNNVVATYRINLISPANRQYTSIVVQENGAILISQMFLPAIILKVKPLF